MPNTLADMDVLDGELSLPRYSGSSGFGSGEKFAIVDCYDYPGRRGHDDTVLTKKAAVARKRRDGKGQHTVDDSVAPNFICANHWNPSFAAYRGELRFHKHADEAQYYAALMSHVSPELRDDWADYDPPNWEIMREYELLDELQEAGQEPSGWDGYEAELAEAARLEEEEEHQRFLEYMDTRFSNRRVA